MRRRRLPTIALLLLLVAQIGLVAHRLEHYLAPDHVECGEDTCAAFAPATDPPAMPVLVLRPISVVFFVRFWTAHENFVEQRAKGVGFRAQAPPAYLA